MVSSSKNVLITGLPGVGKTTLVKKICDSVSSVKSVGFYTEEIRKGGERQGFELISLDGDRRVLSHVTVNSRYRVGKYRVDVGGFETFLDSQDYLNPHVRLVVIDEIGRMECLSGRFRTLVKALLNSKKHVVATIALKGGGLIDEVKSRRDVTSFHLTARNRAEVLREVLSLLRL